MTTAKLPGPGQRQAGARSPQARGYGTEARPSSTPIGRGLGYERGLVSAIGVVLVLAGAAALVANLGAVGTADRPVLDPVLVSWFRVFPLIALPVTIVVGVLLLLLGLWWIARALRPEPKPNLQLAPELTLTAGALTRAVREDAEEVTDVTRAKVRMAGDQRRPNLRLTLALREGADVRAVWDELDDQVLARTRAAVGTETMPTAIRLQLDRSPGQRVR